MSVERPSPALFEGIAGQDDAVAALKAAAVNPVHAYLFRGAEGNGGLGAAHGFAAALLCPTGGCGVCATCRGALSGTDPDLHIVRRSGASLSKDTMRQVVALAQRRPLAAARQVIVVLEMHLVLDRAPVLLKTLEEPPGQTVFILLADELTPDLTTIASRCAEVLFLPLRGTSWRARWRPTASRPTWPRWSRRAAVATWTAPVRWSTTPMWRPGSRSGPRCPTSWRPQVRPWPCSPAGCSSPPTAPSSRCGSRTTVRSRHSARRPRRWANAGCRVARRSSTNTSGRSGASAPTPSAPGSGCWRAPTGRG